MNRATASWKVSFLKRPDSHYAITMTEIIKIREVAEIRGENTQILR